MSGEVVNLRQARKRRDKARREDASVANRALFGRTKAQKEADRLARRKAEADLDGHRRADD